jgi:hypothetical protein
MAASGWLSSWASVEAISPMVTSGRCLQALLLLAGKLFGRASVR